MPAELAFDSANFMEQFSDGLETHTVRISESEEVRVDFGAKQAGSGILRGTVRQGGQSIEGAMITVLSQEPDADSQQPGNWHTSVSKEDGSFEIRGLHPGPSFLQVQKSLPNLAQQFGAYQRRITIRADEDTFLRVELPEGSIEGRVIDGSSNEPLSGVPVYASRAGRGASDGKLAFARSRSAMTSTDEDGNFVLNDLDLGTYNVSAGGMDLFRLASSEHALTTVRDIEVGSGASSSAGVLRLAPAATLSGQVSDASGQPITGASVFLRAAEEGGYLQHLSSAATDSGGIYQYEGIPAGLFDVVCQAPGFAQAEQTRVQLAAGAEGGVDFHLTAGTEVFALLTSKVDLDPDQLELEIVGPNGKIISGLFGFGDLAHEMMRHIQPGSYYLGCYGPGEYEVRGAYQGIRFSRSIELASGQERIEVPIGLP
jgi:hypothetical protein